MLITKAPTMRAFEARSTPPHHSDHSFTALHVTMYIPRSPLFLLVYNEGVHEYQNSRGAPRKTCSTHEPQNSGKCCWYPPVSRSANSFCTHHPKSNSNPFPTKIEKTPYMSDCSDSYSHNVRVHLHGIQGTRGYYCTSLLQNSYTELGVGDPEGEKKILK